jgi:hypothetical protein
LTPIVGEEENTVISTRKKRDTKMADRNLNCDWKQYYKEHLISLEEAVDKIEDGECGKANRNYNGKRY